ncbi:MAG: hypothetical protein ACKPKO_22995, partial [Candidatus Fonsibacter sp.]
QTFDALSTATLVEPTVVVDGSNRLTIELNNEPLRSTPCGVEWPESQRIRHYNNAPCGYQS